LPCGLQAVRIHASVVKEMQRAFPLDGRTLAAYKILVLTRS
jgi:hypothetical protein